MPTNNFGDNWSTKEERAYFGRNEYGETPAEEKSRQESNAHHLSAAFPVFVIWILSGVIVGAILGCFGDQDVTAVGLFVWMFLISPVGCCLLHERFTRDH
jgi:F0F1-type ATP synthase assembly protein I